MERRERLLELYRNKHNGETPLGEDEKIFNFVVEINKIYDNTWNKIQAAKKQNDERAMDFYKKREFAIDRIGHYCRKAIGLLSADPNPFEKQRDLYGTSHGAKRREKKNGKTLQIA